MKVYCVGIGGIGMSAIARLLQGEGHDVSGSDIEHSVVTEALTKEGIRIFYDQNGDHVTADIDIVIYSAAVDASHPELLQAAKFSLPTHTYAEALGELSRQRESIAVSGTHGKTTTTGMLASVFFAAEKSPSCVVGSMMKDFEGLNSIAGQDDTLIVEACEYKQNFHALHPNFVLSTNISFDHCDYFQTEDHYYRTFKSFFSKVPPKGFIVMRVEDSVKVGADYFQCRVVFYDQYVDVLRKCEDLDMQVFGEHNLWNAACVYVFAKEYGIAHEDIIRGLNNFSGTWRRMEYKGRLKGARVYDDYAHHPDEIRATLGAFKQKFPGKKIRAVFQPHQYSRTKHFLQDFGVSFESADEVVISDIYKVRDSEADVASISVDDLVAEISSHNEQVRNGRGIKETASYLTEGSSEGDIVVVMGAGDITNIHEHLDFSEPQQTLQF